MLHTVGPIADGHPTQTDCDLLSSCYKSCLDLAHDNGLKSIAFCCISTGVFGFPQKEAAQIAVAAVKEWKEKNEKSGSSPNMTGHTGGMKVVFNVFTEKDEEIYRRLIFSR